MPTARKKFQIFNKKKKNKNSFFLLHSAKQFVLKMSEMSHPQYTYVCDALLSCWVTALRLATLPLELIIYVLVAKNVSYTLTIGD